jgi:hypothetical protein
LAALSLAARIDETDGKPSRLVVDEVPPAADVPDEPDDAVEPVPEVELEPLPVVDEDDAVDPVLSDVESDPGVPSSAAAWPSTASAFSRPAVGERNEAYSNSAVSCCCSVRYSAWYDESVLVGEVDAVDADLAASGACPVVSNDWPTCESSDVDDDGVEAPEVDEAVDDPSEEPIGERPLMSSMITPFGLPNL